MHKRTAKITVIISFISIFFVELIEEALEELIAWGLSWLIATALSAIIVIPLSMTAKVVIKKTIKLFTYQGGRDKMEKIKTFFLKLGEFFKTNPITIGASVGNLANSSAVGYGIYLAFSQFGWSLPEWAMYLIIAAASALLACLVEWGIICKGWESVAEKALRLETKAQKAEEKKLEEEAAAKLKEEQEANAKLEAEARERLAKQEEEAKAKAEAEAKEQAEKEHEQKVAAKMAELRAAQAQSHNVNFQSLLRK